MSAIVPIEWRPELKDVNEAATRRLKSLMESGSIAPLAEDVSAPHMLLYLIGESLDDISEKMGTPKDIVYLTAIQYNWAAKKEEVEKRGGSEELMKSIRKQLLYNIMIATTKASMTEVGQVMSGKLPASKMPLIPRSLHGLDSLFKMIDEVNEKPAATSQSNVIHAENVQINNQIAAPQPAQEGVVRVSRGERLKQLSGKSDK